MKNMQFSKPKNGYKFKVGDTIKLGGRVGVVEQKNNNYGDWRVIWDDGTYNYVDLPLFPDILLGTPSPTISKEARDMILGRYNDDDDGYLEEILNSMVEE